jgi:hypothetical protein
MISDTGIGTREQFLLAEILWRCDSIQMKLSKFSSTNEAAGGGARGAIGDLGEDGSTGVLGAIADDVLIASDSEARGVGDNIVAKDGSGGDLLGSIDDSANLRVVVGDDNSSTARRVSTSTCTAAAHRGHIRIGPGRRRKP